jgi:ABC-2 type transport system permease protein
MLRYIKINLVLFRNSLIRDSQLPGYVIASLLWRVFDIAVSLIFFNVIFSNVQNLAGWNYWQVIFLYAFARTIIITHSAWTKRGIGSMATDLIRRGEFDFYLAKPVDPMIMVSIKSPRIYNFISVIFMICLAIYAAAKSGIPIGPANIAWFFILEILAFILYYFLMIICIIPAFWFIRLWTISEIMDKLNQFMRYPAGIFSQGLQIIFFLIFPIMAVSYIPAHLLFYPPRMDYIIYMILITLIFGTITRYFWYLGQKSYSSASS